MVRFKAILCLGVPIQCQLLQFYRRPWCQRFYKNSIEISWLRYHVKTRARRGSSFSQLGLEPNRTGWTAQSLFFLEESCRVKRNENQTFSNVSNYFTSFKNVPPASPNKTSSAQTRDLDSRTGSDVRAEPLGAAAQKRCQTSQLCCFLQMQFVTRRAFSVPSSCAAIAMQHHPGNTHQSVATPRYSAASWNVLI